MDRDWPDVKPVGAGVRPLEGSSSGRVALSAFDASLAAPWSILHVRSRQEKVVADALAAGGVAHFLPLSTQTKYYNHRKRVSELPLFPGYLFVRAAPEPLWGAMPTGKVVRLISVADQNGLVADLLQVHRAISEGSGLTRVARVPVGSPVRVSSGPLRDIIGVVERVGGRGRLVIGVRALGQGVSVEIESDLLEPAGETLSR